ncbi:MAG: hypothetical protein R3C11_28125 [Planctomycetaceae bacterium]
MQLALTGNRVPVGIGIERALQQVGKIVVDFDQVKGILRADLPDDKSGESPVPDRLPEL